MKKQKVYFAFKWENLFCIGLIIGCSMFFLSGVTFAAQRTVPSPYTTIQSAIDASVNGDEVIISPGTYMEQIDFGGKNITVRSTDPTNPTIVNTTIIDADENGTVVTFSGTETAACVLSGLTITGGSTNADGGGILGNGTEATITNNLITDNHAALPPYSGGGISGCHGLIENNVISNNSTYSYGGGLDSCNGTIRNNIISGNSGGYGGGLSYCNGTIEYCLVTNNSGANGGGLGFCTATAIRNCTVTLNTATEDGGGMFGCGGLIEYNLFTENTAAEYGGAARGASGTLQYNSFMHNEAKYGGALSGVTGLVANNTITDNTATWIGGALAWGNGTLVNNIFARNSAYEGGAVGFYGNTILNNLFYDNVATEFGGALDSCFGTIENNTVYHNSAGNSGGGFFECDSSTAIQNCIIWDNTAATSPQLHNCATPDYSCIQGWISGGTDNIALNPLFANTLIDDLRLQDTSPCIDAGNPNFQYNDQCIPPGKDTERNDMGAYGGVEGCGWTIPTTMNVPGDFSTIQAAIVAANGGDEIIVAEGTYNENINFLGKNIIVRSSDPTNPSVVQNTIIQAALSFYPVVVFAGTENSTCVLSGFTITGGLGISGNAAMPTIQYNVITGNSGSSYGGGIYECNGLIQYNTISNNSAYMYGGGIGFCHGTIKNNVITGNEAESFGGGLAFCDGTVQSNSVYLNSATMTGGGMAYCGYYSPGTVENNLIFSNSSESGGGVSNCASSVRNNTIYGNSAGTGGGIMNCPDVYNCIIWANTAPTDPQVASPFMAMATPPFYSCIQDWDGSASQHNIADNPQLENPAMGDFHLTPDSPCIDAGMNALSLTSDYEGNTRPRDGSTEVRGDGSDYDIGAYEYAIRPVTGLMDWMDYR